MKDNIQNFSESRAKLIKGVEKVYEVIRPTYGHAGGNVGIETDLYPGHGIYNDGKKITDSVFLADPIEQMGANILKEACDKQEKECGDGRKTTILLTTAILKEGQKYFGGWRKVFPNDIKKSLELELVKIQNSLTEQKVDIPVEEIYKIAKISSESDVIAGLIGNIYPLIGREGIIEVEASHTKYDSFEIKEGIRLYGAKLFAGWQTEPGACVIKNPKIIICKEKISTRSQIEPIYKKLVSANVKEVILYCDEIENSVVNGLAKTNYLRDNPRPDHWQEDERLPKTLIIKSPTIFKDWLYEDLEKMTGAKPISSKEGRMFQDFGIEHMGTCEEWKATAEESLLKGTKDISEHIKSLAIDPDENMKVRLNWLNTKVAIVKVGSPTETDLSGKIRKTMDAANACRLALKDGVVKGAGKSLIEASKALNKKTIGGKILSKALCYPYKQIVENSGDTEIPDYVIDPVVVERSAVTTAVSLAGTILTIKGAIHIPDHIKELARQAIQRAQR